MFPGAMALPPAVSAALRRTGGRLSPLWCAALGTALFIPSLWGGLGMDDHLQRAVITQSDVVRPLVGQNAGMFGFAGFGGRAQTLHGVRTGALPWWTSPHTQLNFWRPLSELTHRVDYRLFPDSHALMHLHNLFWYFLLLCAAGLLYRRIHAARAVAGLCALLYALDDGHTLGASWIANRNGVITALFVTLTIYFHDRSRRGGSQLSAVGAWLIAIPGLLSGEGYVAVLGYLFAHALTLDRGPIAERMRYLVPYLAIVLGWHAVYARLGYGSYGSAFYVDPGREPLLFAAQLFPRLSLLLGSHFAIGMPEMAGLMGDNAGKLVALAHFCVLAFVGWLAWPVVRRSATGQFWALGALMSAVPFCATLPMERNLLVPGIGAMGLLGKFTADYFRRGARQRPARLVQACVSVFLVQHLVLSPLAKPIKALALPGTLDRVDDCGEALAKVDKVEGRFAVALNASDGCTAFARIIAAEAGYPVPLTFRTLSDGYRRTEVERIDAQTLRIRPEGGFFAIPFARLFLDRRAPMVKGHRVQLPELTVIVVETTRDGRPAAIDVRFATNLDDDRYRLLVAAEDGLRTIEPPQGKLVLGPRVGLL